MSRSYKAPREFIPIEVPGVSPITNTSQSSGFLDIVAKFGPLVIAIIAVAFCFYIYKKVVEMDKTPNAILQAFIQDQTQTNYQIQESYNSMVEQFNNLSGVVHTSLVKDGTIETQISPSPSIINETVVSSVDEVLTVEQPDEILDDVSELSVSTSQTKRRGRKPKNEVNF